MKNIVTNGLLAAAFCFSIVACNAPDNKETDSTEIAEEQNEEKMPSDEAEDHAEFMVKAASGGLMEVELGRMALEKASSPEVKNFAQMMINDHTKANEELKALALQKNITIPATPGAEAQEHINALVKYSGTEFDEEYIEFMVKDHKEDISLFQEAAEDAKDAAIKAFATKTLPVLKHHYQMAEEMEAQTKNNPNAAMKSTQ